MGRILAGGFGGWDDQHFLADDPTDLDWMPPKLWTKAEKRRKKKGEHSQQRSINFWILIV